MQRTLNINAACPPAACQSCRCVCRRCPDIAEDLPAATPNSSITSHGRSLFLISHLWKTAPRLALTCHSEAVCADARLSNGQRVRDSWQLLISHLGLDDGPVFHCRLCEASSCTCWDYSFLRSTDIFWRLEKRSSECDWHRRPTRWSLLNLVRINSSSKASLSLNIQRCLQRSFLVKTNGSKTKRPLAALSVEAAGTGWCQYDEEI